MEELAKTDLLPGLLFKTGGEQVWKLLFLSDQKATLIAKLELSGQCCHQELIR